MNKKLLISIIYGLVLILSIILFRYSFNSVPLNQFAIIQNNFSKIINTENIYPPGRYFIGLGNIFRYYPSKWQISRFAKNQLHTVIPINSGTIFSKTKDTANVEISCIVTYKLIPANIFELYKNWQTNTRHNADVIKIIRSTITQIINLFNYGEIIRDRKRFSKIVSYRLSLELKNKLLCELQDFILEFVFINDRIESTIENNLILIQTRKTEKINNLIRKLNGSINHITSDGLTREKQIITNAKIEAIKTKSNIDKQKFFNKEETLRLPLQNIKNLFSQENYYMSSIYLLDLLKKNDVILEWKYDLKS